MRRTSYSTRSRIQQLVARVAVDNTGAEHEGGESARRPGLPVCAPGDAKKIVRKTNERAKKKGGAERESFDGLGKERSTLVKAS